MQIISGATICYDLILSAFEYVFRYLILFMQST